MKYVICFLLGALFEYFYGVYRGMKMLKKIGRDEYIFQKIDEMRGKK